mmetsp:Transcript_1119/g.2448  ORF Transcript_1119/g.2448 Transcript_1119/m.2448 type:complete len:201 (-) Transcript_1119:1013-1615(-)
MRVPITNAQAHIFALPTTGPRHASLGRYFVSTFRSCSMSNSSVASLPAYSVMARLPPGWSGRNSVTSYTMPASTTQQSLSLLCLATSSIVYPPAAGDAVGAAMAPVGAAATYAPVLGAGLSTMDGTPSCTWSSDLSSSCFAAVAPETRPYTTQSRSEFPPRRLRPWMPPATSPAAVRPSITLPDLSSTFASASMCRPPMQ